MSPIKSVQKLENIEKNAYLKLKHYTLIYVVTRGCLGSRHLYRHTIKITNQDMLTVREENSK